ncbi:MAG: hypothetical protein LHW57_00155 [Candidatus Cloacimonetes bacterium]|nr:hypothetical protein [Candidatus Cloacimonadota bacterium]
MRNIAILLALLLALSGCDLFRLRESEPPVEQAPWNSYPTNWDLCLQNLDYCYEDSRNAVKYAGLFTQDFSFRFAAQDVNDYNLPASWNAAQEQDMLLNLFSQYPDLDNAAVTLSPLASQPDDISSSEARIYREYELTGFPSLAGASGSYRGELEIHLRKSGAYWYISKWFDYRSFANPTWGRMKHGFSQ